MGGMGERSDDKDYRIRFLLPVAIDALKKDNEQLKMINHAVKVKPKSQVASLAAYEETLIFCY